MSEEPDQAKGVGHPPNAAKALPSLTQVLIFQSGDPQIASSRL